MVFSVSPTPPPAPPVSSHPLSGLFHKSIIAASVDPLQGLYDDDDNFPSLHEDYQCQEQQMTSSSPPEREGNGMMAAVVDVLMDVGGGGGGGGDTTDAQEDKTCVHDENDDLMKNNNNSASSSSSVFISENLPLCPSNELTVFTSNSPLDPVVVVPSSSVSPSSQQSSCPFLPIIQNIIASVHLDAEVDLRQIAVSARNVEYNPKKVNAAVLRLREPKCTGLIFRSGRMMITGARSEDAAKTGGKRMAKLVQKSSGNLNVKFVSFKIENMIATADCGVPVRLEGLANDHKEFCSYEPELFAGLVYRYNPSALLKAVLLIFVSGKVIITGCRSRVDVISVFDNIYPVVMQYQK